MTDNEHTFTMRMLTVCFHQEGGEDLWEEIAANENNPMTTEIYQRPSLASFPI